MNAHLDPELIAEILSCPGTFENKEETVCREMVGELTPQERELAACTSYVYSVYSRKEGSPSEEITERMAMKEARRHLYEHKLNYAEALKGLKRCLSIRKVRRKLQILVSYLSHVFTHYCMVTVWFFELKEMNIDLLRFCFAEETTGSALTGLSVKEREIVAKLESLIAPEMAIQSMIPHGHDRANCAIVHRSDRLTAQCDKEAFYYVAIYGAERGMAATEILSKGRECTVVGVLHLDNYRLSRVPPTSIISKGLQLMQLIYPGRIKKAFVTNPPFWFRAIYAILSPFLSREIRNLVSCNLRSVRDS